MSCVVSQCTLWWCAWQTLHYTKTILENVSKNIGEGMPGNVVVRVMPQGSHQSNQREREITLIQWGCLFTLSSMHAMGVLTHFLLRRVVVALFKCHRSLTNLRVTQDVRGRTWGLVSKSNKSNTCELRFRKETKRAVFYFTYRTPMLPYIPHCWCYRILLVSISDTTPRFPGRTWCNWMENWLCVWGICIKCLSTHL